MSRPDLTLAREFEAALAWWQAAGVDCDFVDDATAWLGEPVPDAVPAGSGSGPARSAPPRSADRSSPVPSRSGFAPPPASPEPIAAPAANLLGDSPPGDLAAFRQWWMAAPDLAPPTGFGRVPPRGEAKARLMVLVPQPEAGDSDRLLDGPQGRLLAAILAAMGLAESEVYLASALPCHTPMADLAAQARRGLDAVTAHHISLARPQRIVAFGMGLGTMLGAGVEASGGHALREINQTGCKTPVIVSETLDAMMDMPRLKSRFWRRWMEWSEPV